MVDMNGEAPFLHHSVHSYQAVALLISKAMGVMYSLLREKSHFQNNVKPIRNSALIFNPNAEL